MIISIFFLIIKYFFIRICAFFAHNAIAHSINQSVNITFTCTGKPKKLCDLLYFDINFIAVVWDETYNVFKVCLQVSSIFFLVGRRRIRTQILKYQEKSKDILEFIERTLSLSSFKILLFALYCVVVMVYFLPSLLSQLEMVFLLKKKKDVS